MNITGLGSPAAGLNDPWYTNYQTLITDPKMATALKNTLILTVATIVFQVRSEERRVGKECTA